MNFQDTVIGMEVVRTKGDYVVGRTGEVVERNEDAQRVRVAWKGEARTWVSVSAIEPTYIPYDIVRGEQNKKTGRLGNPKYIKRALTIIMLFVSLSSVKAQSYKLFKNNMTWAQADSTAAATPGYHIPTRAEMQLLFTKNIYEVNNDYYYTIEYKVVSFPASDTVRSIVRMYGQFDFGPQGTDMQGNKKYYKLLLIKNI